MIDLKLTGPDRQAYLMDLADSHFLRVTMKVLDRNEKVLESFQPVVLGGGVQIDNTAETTRQLQVSLLDRDHRMEFDGESPASGALFADRFISVEYGILGPHLGRWHDVETFWGPVTGFKRAGAQVDLTCMGKEHLLREMLWENITKQRGTKKVNVIRSLARSMGERRFDLPDLGAKIGERVSYGRRQQAWGPMKQMAKSMDRQLFYDGAGRLKLRRLPSQPVFTFRLGEAGLDGPRPMVLSDPDLTYDVASVRNTILVTATKKGSKKQLSWTAKAARNHPLSPWSLARNGEPRHLVEVVQLNRARSQREVRNVAQRTLRKRLQESLEAAFECLPVPFLEEGDLVALETPDYHLTFRIRQMTLPLSAADSMSVGFLKRVKPNRRRLR